MLAVGRASLVVIVITVMLRVAMFTMTVSMVTMPLRAASAVTMLVAVAVVLGTFVAGHVHVTPSVRAVILAMHARHSMRTVVPAHRHHVLAEAVPAEAVKPWPAKSAPVRPMAEVMGEAVVASRPKVMSGLIVTSRPVMTAVAKMAGHHRTIPAVAAAHRPMTPVVAMPEATSHGVAMTMTPVPTVETADRGMMAFTTPMTESREMPARRTVVTAIRREAMLPVGAMERVGPRAGELSPTAVPSPGAVVESRPAVPAGRVAVVRLRCVMMPTSGVRRKLAVPVRVSLAGMLLMGVLLMGISLGGMFLTVFLVSLLALGRLGVSALVLLAIGRQHVFDVSLDGRIVSIARPAAAALEPGSDPLERFAGQLFPFGLLLVGKHAAEFFGGRAAGLLKLLPHLVAVTAAALEQSAHVLLRLLLDLLHLLALLVGKAKLLGNFRFFNRRQAACLQHDLAVSLLLAIVEDRRQRLATCPARFRKALPSFLAAQIAKAAKRLALFGQLLVDLFDLFVGKVEFLLHRLLTEQHHAGSETASRSLLGLCHRQRGRDRRQH